MVFCPNSNENIVKPERFATGKLAEFGKFAGSGVLLHYFLVRVVSKL